MMAFFAIVAFFLQFGFNAYVLMAIGRKISPAIPQPPPPPKPICGCEHNLAYHDPKTGTCNQQVKRVTKYLHGEVSQWKMINCLCKQYSGPKPLEEFFSTPNYLES